MLLKFDWLQLEQNLVHILKAALIVVIGYFAAKYLSRLIIRSLSRTHMDESLIRFIAKTVKIVVYIIILLSALNALGISTTGLLAALSAAAVGIALALKDSLSNIAGGILLFLSPRFATGDIVEIDGKVGTVLQVDLMHTTIRTYDNRHVIIPNGSIMGSKTINMSQEEKLRVDHTFSVSYDDDIELVKSSVTDALKNYPLVLKDEEIFVRVNEYAQSSVDVLVRVWCKTEDYWTVYFDVLDLVKKTFDKNGITVPFNQLDVSIKENKVGS